jgi:protein TonB
LLFTTLAYTVAMAQTPTAAPNDTAWQTYSYVLRTSTLEWLDSQPFQLRVDYQLYDLNGNPSQKGTAGETWGEGIGRQVTVQSPTLKIERPEDLSALRTLTRERYLVLQALHALVRPFPAPIARKDFAIDAYRREVAGSDTSCFSIVRPGTARDAAAPGYCTDTNNHIIAMTGNDYLLQRSDFREFLGHRIPLNVSLSYGEKTALTMHVTELDALTAPRVATSRANAPTRTQVSADLMVDRTLKHQQPKYPKEAKKKHITGTVILEGVIDKAGKMALLEVIASPDPLLSDASVEAVRKWTYKPYVSGGVPVEVDTTIVVNFSMNRNE